MFNSLSINCGVIRHFHYRLSIMCQKCSFGLLRRSPLKKRLNNNVYKYDLPRQIKSVLLLLLEWYVILCENYGAASLSLTDETRLLPEIKHLHFNEMFIWKQCNYIPEKNMSLHNFLLFHLIRHVKNSGFALYNGFQTARERWKLINLWPWGFICFSAFAEPYEEALALILNILHQFLKIILSLLTTCFPCRTTFEIIIAWSVTICNKTWSFRRYHAISSPIPPIIDDFPPWSILSNCTWSACVIGGAVSFKAITRSAYTGYVMLRFRRKLTTNTANYQRVCFVQLINLIPLVTMQL